jgi:hypothetical protein
MKRNWNQNSFLNVATTGRVRALNRILKSIFEGPAPVGDRARRRPVRIGLPLLVVLLAAGMCPGCGKHDAAPVAKSIVRKAKPAVSATEPVPEPEPAADSEGSPAGSAAAPLPEAEPGSLVKETEAERLTRALQDYYTRNGAAAPPVTGFATLVKAEIIKSVPVPPPGMKFVIDKKLLAVRLEKN